MLREADHKMLLSRQVTDHLNKWGSLFLGGLNQPLSSPESFVMNLVSHSKANRSWLISQGGVVSCHVAQHLTRVKLKDWEHLKINLCAKLALVYTSTDIIF